MAPRRSTRSLAIAGAVLLCLSLDFCSAHTFSRKEWGSQPLIGKNKTYMQEPVAFVVIHHTVSPAVCETALECQGAMRSVQRNHITDRQWDDIGYTFCVGGDGNVYEGRGWGVVGAHAPPLNKNSVGICLFGDYRKGLPRASMLSATKNLIEQGVREGHIAANYTLLGHSDVRPTECPGGALYEEIKKWDHFWTAPAAPSAPAYMSTTEDTPSYVFMKRQDWDAKPPNKTDKMPGPTPVVVIHHTKNRTICLGTIDCALIVKDIQQEHLDKGYDDIAYAFCVGGRGEAIVFEGRGWDVKGQFFYGYGTERSVDICIIGDHTTEGPDDAVKAVTQELIARGVMQGHIAPNYKLVGHKNLHSTQCPGDALQRSIETWPHFDKGATSSTSTPPNYHPHPVTPPESKPSTATPAAVWTVWHTTAILVFHGLLLGRY